MEHLLGKYSSNPNLRVKFGSIRVFINLFGYTHDLVLIDYSKLYLKVGISYIFGATSLYVQTVLISCLIDLHVRFIIVEDLIRVFFPIFFLY